MPPWEPYSGDGGTDPSGWWPAGSPYLLLGRAPSGSAEEYFPFVPVLVTLALALGYDRITAVGIIMVGYGVGYGAALINPFTVLLAQDIAGLQPASGLWYRVALMVVFLPICIHHVWYLCEEGGAGSRGEPGRRRVGARRDVDLQWRRWGSRGKPSSDDHHAQADPGRRWHRYGRHGLWTEPVAVVSGRDGSGLHRSYSGHGHHRPHEPRPHGGGVWHGRSEPHERCAADRRGPGHPSGVE